MKLCAAIFPVIVLSGCAWDAPSPRLLTLGASQPICLLFCEIAVEAVNTENGSATGAPITQSEGANAQNRRSR